LLLIKLFMHVPVMHKTTRFITTNHLYQRLI
jgi:hypothetical protein